jgi:hypothetical protein
MAIDRLLRPSRGVLAVPMADLADGTTVLVGPDGSTCPFDAPTHAILDAWRAIATTTPDAATFGGNISAALVDSLDLGLAASTTDNELVITSLGNEVSPTFRNVDMKFDVMRDANKNDTGVFNLATNLFKGKDSRYGFVDRIGSDAAAAYAAGQVVSIYEGNTDAPIDVAADRANLKLEQNPITTGNVTDNYTLGA